MSKPKYWPSNLPWDNSYVIVAELESYPPVYVLSTGTRIRGELSLSDFKRATYVPTVRSKKSKRRSRKSKRRSRKTKRRSRKSKRRSRKSKRRSRRC